MSSEKFSVERLDRKKFINSPKPLFHIKQIPLPAEQKNKWLAQKQLMDWPKTTLVARILKPTLIFGTKLSGVSCVLYYSAGLWGTYEETKSVYASIFNGIESSLNYFKKY
jgi:hypothetical protein